MFISFVVPCYNAARYLPKLLESVLGQTDDDWEMLLIDDGSEDNTKTVVDSYLENPRIRYYYQTNKGVSSARNNGISKARGECVTCVDADDWLDIHFVELFKKLSIADVNICGYREVYNDGEYREISPTSLQYSYFPLDDYTVRNSFFRTPWAVVFRRNFLKSCNLIFPETLAWGEDTMFLLYATMAANSILFVPNVLYNYRFTGEGLTNSIKRHSNMLQFLNVYSNARSEVRLRSEHAWNMMNELILFLSVILLREIMSDKDKTNEEKKEYTANIDCLFRTIPFLFSLRKKVGRIRYIIALCSRLLPSSISFEIYKKMI